MARLKLTRAERSECRTFHRAGIPQSLLATEYNCSTSAIYNCVHNVGGRDNLESDDEYLDPGDLVLSAEMRAALIKPYLGEEPKGCHGQARKRNGKRKQAYANNIKKKRKEDGAAREILQSSSPSHSESSRTPSSSTFTGPSHHRHALNHTSIKSAKLHSHPNLDELFTLSPLSSLESSSLESLELQAGRQDHKEPSESGRGLGKGEREHETTGQGSCLGSDQRKDGDQDQDLELEIEIEMEEEERKEREGSSFSGFSDSDDHNNNSNGLDSGDEPEPRLGRGECSVSMSLSRASELVSGRGDVDDCEDDEELQVAKSLECVM